MIPFILALMFSILVTLVFVIPGLFLFYRWITVISSSDFDMGDMKVPTFYSAQRDDDGIQFMTCVPIVGLIFGGIHCVGWFYVFPSTDEAMLWRVSSAVLTGTAFLFPFFMVFVVLLMKLFFTSSRPERQFLYFSHAVFSIILLVYVVSRLLLLVEAFISLRYLTPGMLELVEWTSFIPHI